MLGVSYTAMRLKKCKILENFNFEILYHFALTEVRIVNSSVI
jgi:hypothetical protein